MCDYWLLITDYTINESKWYIWQLIHLLQIQIITFSAANFLISINTHIKTEKKKKMHRPLAVVGERSSSFIFLNIELPFILIVSVLYLIAEYDSKFKSYPSTKYCLIMVYLYVNASANHISVHPFNANRLLLLRNKQLEPHVWYI